MQQLVPLRVCVAAALAGLLSIGLLRGVTFARRQEPTFRTGTGIIEVEVTVLDTNGVPVPDLTSSEFQIFEDDVLQKIVSFSLNTVDPSPIRYAVGVAKATVEERVNDSRAGNTFVLMLDSGCLWGGTLTAMRLPDRRVYQVPSRSPVNPAPSE